MLEKSLIRRLLKIWALAFIFFAISAYASPTVELYVNGYANGNIVSGTRYYIMLEDKIDPNQFEFKEYSSYLERALLTKGMVRTDNLKDADIIVFLGYEIGAPKSEVASYSLPVFGQTGVGSSYTSGTISRSGNISATTTNIPTYGVTGSTSTAYSYEIYDRWLRATAVNAVKFRETGSVVQTWQMDVKSTGTSGDLRYIFPKMAYSLSLYVGQDTGKAIKLKVKDNSKELRAISALPVSRIGPIN